MSELCTISKAILKENKKNGNETGTVYEQDSD